MSSYTCDFCYKPFSEKKRYLAHLERCPKLNGGGDNKNDPLKQEINTLKENQDNLLYTIESLQNQIANAPDPKAIFLLEESNRLLVARLNDAKRTDLLDNQKQTIIDQYVKNLTEKTVEIEMLKKYNDRICSEQSVIMEQNKNATNKIKLELESQHRKLIESKIDEIQGLKKMLETQKEEFSAKFKNEVTSIQSRFNVAKGQTDTTFEVRVKELETELKKCREGSVVMENEHKRVNAILKRDYDLIILKYSGLEAEQIHKFQAQNSEIENLRASIRNHEKTISEQRVDISQKARDIENVKIAYSSEIDLLRMEYEKYKTNTSKDFEMLRQQMSKLQNARAQESREAEERDTKSRGVIADKTFKIGLLEEKCKEMDSLRSTYLESIQKHTKLEEQYKLIHQQYTIQVDELNSLKKSHQTDREKLDIANNTLGEFMNKVTFLTSQYAHEKGITKQFQQMISTQKEELEQLQTRYNDVQEKYHMVLNSTKTAISDERELVSNLKEELAKATTALKNQQDLQNRISEHEKTHMIVKSKLSSLNDTLHKKLVENKNLTKDAVEKDKKFDKLVEENRVLETTLNDCKVITAKLREQIESLKRKIQENENVFISNKKTMEEMKSTNRAYESKNISLQKTIDDLTNELKSVVKNKCVIEENLLTCDKNLSECRKDLNKFRSLADTLKGTCGALEEHCTHLIKDKEDLNEKYLKIHTQSTETIRVLETKCDSRGKEIITLNEMVRSHEENNKSVSAMEITLRELRNNCNTLITEKESIQSAYQQYNQKFKSTIQHLEQQNATLTEETRKMSVEIAQLQDKARRARNTEQTMMDQDKLKSEIIGLERKVTDAENQKNAMRKVYDTMITEFQECKIKLKDQQVIAVRFKDEKVKNTDLENQLTLLQTSLGKTEHALGKSRGETAQKEADINDLKKSLEKEQEAGETLRNKMEKYVQSLSYTKETVNAWIRRAGEVEAKLNYAQGQLSNMKCDMDEMVKLKDDVVSKDITIKNSKKLTTELQDRIMEIEKELGISKNDLAKHLVKMHAQRSEITANNVTIEKIKSNLERETLLNKTTIRNLSTQLDELSKKLIEANHKIVDMRQKDGEIRELKFALDGKTAELQKVNQELTEVKSTFTNLQSKHADISEKLNSSRLVQLQIDRLIEENETLKMEHKIHLNQLGKIREIENQQPIIDDLEYRLKRASQENEDLVKNIREIEYDRSLYMKCREEISRLNIVLTGVRSENTTLEKKLSELPTMFEIKQREELLEKISSEHAIMTKRLTALNGQIRVLDKLKDDLKTKTNIIQQKDNDILQLTNRTVGFTDQINEYKDVIQTLRQEMTVTKDTIAPLQEGIRKRDTEIENLRKAPAMLDVKVRKLRDESIQTIHRYINNEKQTKQFLAQAQEKNRELQQMVEMLSNEIDQSNGDMEHLIAMKDELKQNFIQNLNDQKVTGDIQVQEMRRLLELRDERVKDIESLLNSFITKKLLR